MYSLLKRVMQIITYSKVYVCHSLNIPESESPIYKI